ncbi:MAG: TetR/AcrR family transcriptional regulator [Kiritimatiellae bacterium]|nr:TetR/AcrR family transcriptional regulator [Kiritimatiellia bacterium]
MKNETRDTADQTTRAKILEAATTVFAEKGFRDGTTRMICQAAKVNVALVNYYFRSKHDLYKEVVLNLFEGIIPDLTEPLPPITDEASWRAAIRRWVGQILALCASEEPPLCNLARLMGHEASLPTDVSQTFEKQLVRPLRDRFIALLKMGLNAPTETELNLWFSSVHAQCAIYAIAKPDWRQLYCPKDLPLKTWLEKVSDHICGVLFDSLSFQGGAS